MHADAGVCYGTLETPLGVVVLVGTSRAVQAIRLPGATDPAAIDPAWTCRPDVFTEASRQLLEYLAGRRRAFDLPLDPRGTAFQQRVWTALRRVPYGTTTSYARLAEAIGAPRAVRAVGLANGANPLPIIVPCHRVIGSNGSLVGYGGGLPAKRFLLALERGAAVQPELRFEFG